MSAILLVSEAPVGQGMINSKKQLWCDILFKNSFVSSQWKLEEKPLGCAFSQTDQEEREPAPALCTFC